MCHGKADKQVFIVKINVGLYREFCFYIYRNEKGSLLKKNGFLKLYRNHFDLYRFTFMFCKVNTKICQSRLICLCCKLYVRKLANKWKI